MNTMMKIAAAGALMLLAACGKDDPGAAPKLTISPAAETISFGADAGEDFTFEVSTNQPVWLAFSDQEWCKVEIDARAGTFTVSALPNDATTPPPPATITVSAGQALKLTFTATQAAAEYDIYMAGTCDYQAYYWKNGERTLLDGDLTDSQSTSITASDGSIYISGKSGQTPCYWKDGVRFDLPDHYANDTYSIAVENQSVYILGYKGYWKDDTVVPVNSSSDFDLYSDAIAVSGGTVYIAGESNRQAVFWSDGEFNLLAHPGGSNPSSASCVTVSDGSVYIGGQYQDANNVDRLCYWKDGVLTPLEIPEGVNHPSVDAIAVENGKVYAAGGFYNLNTSQNEYCYWADGKCILLEMPADVEHIRIGGMAVAGGKVYVAGSFRTNDYKYYASYLVDGKPSDMKDESADVSVCGIALVKK